MIRISNETEEAFPDPILQVKLQRHQLFHWLNQNNCKPIPIETCVVITSPYTHLKTSAESGNQYQHVIHSANLPFTFESFEKKHQKPKISKRDLRDTADILIKQNQPYTFDALQRYHISSSEVMTGVICPDCFCLPMTKTFGKWKCSSCSTSSKNAHLPALRDYSLLVNSTISNREARRFLHMGSRSAVSKLFHSMKLPYEGSYKGTRYHLSLNE